jgi:hypothetical protein
MIASGNGGSYFCFTTSVFNIDVGTSWAAEPSRFEESFTYTEAEKQIAS